MDSENLTRKSSRQRRKSVVLEDYVANEVYFDDDFVTLDEEPPGQSDSPGIYYTHVWLLVQSGPPLTFFISEQQVSQEREEENAVNSKMEEELDINDEISEE